MNVAVGEGRAVVQHKGGRTVALFQHFMVNILLFKRFEQFRLPYGQIGPHGEFGFGQIQCACVVFCHFLAKLLFAFSAFASILQG